MASENYGIYRVDETGLWSKQWLLLIFHTYFILVLLVFSFRYSIIIFRYSIIIFRYSIIIFRYSIIIFRYSIIIFRYSIIIFRYITIIFSYREKQDS